MPSTPLAQADHLPDVDSPCDAHQDLLHNRRSVHSTVLLRKSQLLVLNAITISPLSISGTCLLTHSTLRIWHAPDRAVDGILGSTGEDDCCTARLFCGLRSSIASYSVATQDHHVAYASRSYLRQSLDNHITPCIRGPCTNAAIRHQGLTAAKVPILLHRVPCIKFPALHAHPSYQLSQESRSLAHHLRDFDSTTCDLIPRMHELPHCCQSSHSHTAHHLSALNPSD